MSKKQTTTNTYAYQAPPETADTTAARGQLQNVDFHSPIVAAYGKAGNDIQNQQYEDTLPEFAKQRIRNSNMFNLNTSKGEALGNAAAQENAFKTSGMLSLAGLTSPRLVQTGGTSKTSDPMGWVNTLGSLGAGFFCWVAEELYGVQDPRVTLLRAWLIGGYSNTRRGRIFLRLYKSYGPRWASLIRSYPSIRSLFQHLFDGFLIRAERWWNHV